MAPRPGAAERLGARPPRRLLEVRRAAEADGEKRGSFALEGSNWFPRPGGEPSEAAWKADLALLAAEHRALVAAVERQLPGLRGAARAKALHLVRGVAAHDLYHAGQVQLLKRLRAEG